MQAELEITSLQVTPLQPWSGRFQAGELISITGASGSGKSRFLLALADMTAHEGSIRWRRQEQASLPPPQWRSKVMLLPSNPSWWFASARDHFQQGPTDKDLEALRLNQSLLDVPVEQLSTGEKQRLALLRVLDRNPEVLLLDEATANLDDEGALAVESLLLRWLREAPRLIFWSSHHREQIKRLSGRELHIDHGCIRERKP